MNTQTPAAICTPLSPPAKVAYFQRLLGMDLVVIEFNSTHKDEAAIDAGDMLFGGLCHIVSAERLAESLVVEWDLIKTMITSERGASIAHGYGTMCLLYCGIDLNGEVSHPQNSGLFIMLNAVKSLILDIDMAALEQTHSEAVRNRIADMKADIRSVQGCHWNSLDPHNAITNSDSQGFAAAKNLFH